MALAVKPALNSHMYQSHMHTNAHLSLFTSRSLPYYLCSMRCRLAILSGFFQGKRLLASLYAKKIQKNTSNLPPKISRWSTFEVLDLRKTFSS